MQQPPFQKTSEHQLSIATRLGIFKANLGHVLPGGGKQATAKLLSSAGVD
jgi:hypothetical protein